MNKQREYVRETRIIQEQSPIAGLLQDEYIVRAYSIISTDLVAFDVYVVASSPVGFGSLYHDEERGLLGKLTSARPVDRILALPYGDERTQLVTEHYDALHKREREAIEAAYGFVPSDNLTTIREFRAAVMPV